MMEQQSTPKRAMPTMTFAMVIDILGLRSISIIESATCKLASCGAIIKLQAQAVLAPGL